MNTMIEMYDRIMSVVEEVTGISKDKILTSNCEECVDARHILVYILGNRSFSDNKIAELTGLTRPGVCIIRNNFKYRRKRYFVNLNYERVYAKVFDSKNCATCDIGNRAYCAVQLGLKNQELLMNMQTIISGLIQVLTPILTPGSAPIQSPNLGGDVPAEEKPKAEEAPNKK